MEEALRIFDYLPIAFKDQNEQDYIVHLRESFEVNYEKGKYQFAFLAYHMLFMSFVYYEIWQIREIRRGDFDKAMIGFDPEEKEINNDERPFALWRVNESRVFRLLKLLGCPDDQVGNFKAIVKLRNEIAHVNGSRPFAERHLLDSKIGEILRHTEKIQSFTEEIIVQSFKNFLLSSFDPEGRGFFGDEDEIRENLVHRHYLSMEDIRFLMRYEIDRLADHPNFSQIQQLFKAFVNIYKED